MALTREAGKNGKLATLLTEAGIASVEVRLETQSHRVRRTMVHAPYSSTDAFVLF